jgi:hypothetical protein
MKDQFFRSMCHGLQRFGRLDSKLEDLGIFAMANLKMIVAVPSEGVESQNLIIIQIRITTTHDKSQCVRPGQ